MDRTGTVGSLIVRNGRGRDDTFIDDNKTKGLYFVVILKFTRRHLMWGVGGGGKIGRG